MKKLISTLALGGSVLLLTGCGDLLWPENGPTLTGTQAAAQPLSLSAGTFTASAPSFIGDLTLSVTASSSNITGITVTSHTDTPDIAEPAFETMIERIIRYNSTGVDAVTGATESSNALLRAVEYALVNQAGANLETLRASGPGVGVSNFQPGPVIGVGQGGFGGAIEVFVNFTTTGIDSVAIANHNESSVADPAFEALIANAIAIGSGNVDIFTGATLTSMAFSNAINHAIAQSITDPSLAPYVPEVTLTQSDDPNVFIAAGQGFGGPVEIAFTIIDGTIVDVEVLNHSETPSFTDTAFPELVSRLIAVGSADIDIYTGATVTSGAVIDAVYQAFMLYRGETPAEPEPVDHRADLDLTGTHDGVFFGQGEGPWGDILLTLTIANGNITAMEILAHNDTPEHAYPAFEAFQGWLINEQVVDTLTSSTATSLGVIEAVHMAIANAVANNPFEGLDEVVADEAEETEEPATAEEAPATETAADTPAEPAAPSFAGGTFTGSSNNSFDHNEGEGGSGSLTVAVTLDSNRAITAFNVTQFTDTPNFLNNAVAGLSGLVGRTDANIDTVSGATYSSTAILEAVRSALASAQ